MVESWFRNKPRSNSIMSMLGVPQPGQMGSPPASWGNSNYPPISSPFPYSPRPLPQWPQQPQPQPRPLAPSMPTPLSLGLPPPNYEGVGDDNYDEPGSQTPADASVQGDYSDVNGRDVAKGGSTIASALGLPGAMLGALGVTAYDYFNPFDPYSNSIPDEIASWRGERGPQSDPSALAGLGMSTENLDTVGGLNYDFSPYGYGMQGIQNALNGVTAAEVADAETGFGGPDNETDAATGPGSVGGVGDDEAASTSGGGEDGGSGGSGAGEASEGGDSDEDGADGGLAKGGIVTKGILKGANPPGPDDGNANLDAGEYVIRADAVKHYGADFFERLNSRKILKKSARGLLGVK
jgi:hypothetical protein